MLAFVVLVLAVFTFSVKVATLSHPLALVKVTVLEPAAVKVNPFQLYGKAVAQTDNVSDDDVG